MIKISVLAIVYVMMTVYISCSRDETTKAEPDPTPDPICNRPSGFNFLPLITY